jgi:hypothetical protein
LLAGGNQTCSFDEHGEEIDISGTAELYTPPHPSASLDSESD